MRRFRTEHVGREIIQRIIETATYAPNAHNRQAWRFINLETQKSRVALADAMGVDFAQTLRTEKLTEEEIAAQLARSKARILEAPAAILLCLDLEALDKYADTGRTQGEYLMGVQSVALAGGQLLLAAHAERLGAVWICSPLFTPEPVAKALDLPDSWQAQGLILLGYPVKTPEERPRLNVKDVTTNR